MHEFIAKNPKQLDLCLRLLYAEDIPFNVRIRESNKKKIEYVIAVTVDDSFMAKLEERYRILIS